MKRRWIALWLMIVLALTMLVGCGGGGSSAAATNETQVTLESAPDVLESVSDSVYEATSDISSGSQETSADSAQDYNETPEIEAQAESGQTGDEYAADDTENAATGTSETDEAAYEIDENGSYTSKEDVALYLHVYGHLPDNFMTKKEAKKLGWTGGSLEDYAPGMCIGGDYFGNYEGILPDGDYHECDIDTLGKSKRGAKRIIYSDDGRIYYTDDHYESFEVLYE